MSIHPITDPVTEPPPSPADPGGTGAAPRPRRAGRPHRSPRRDRRLAYCLIAPAVVFMVLVHLLPAAAGVALSFKNLNTFTFSRLFGAPWNGLDNYKGILFDSANPLHSGFWGAVQNTAVYVFWTVSLTLAGGMLIALLLN